MLDKLFGKKKNRLLSADKSSVEMTLSNSGVVARPPQFADQHFPTGTRINNRYEVVRVLEGGMGLVYLCIDHEKEARPVALKTFKPKFLPDRHTRDRFLREGTIWVALGRHPNIVHAYGVERATNGIDVFLVLEWVAAMVEDNDDSSLRALLLAKNKLSLEDSLTYALHIARGMKHATTKIPGLVHRDLKPENILVGRDGNARVTDFGLAGVLSPLQENLYTDSKKIRTSDGGVGTPLYMAPEQWKRRGRIDARTDIYAFGCIFHEMLSGKPAVSGANATDLSRAHQLGWKNPLPDDLPTEVKALVQGCTAVNSGRRFQSWANVEKAISLVYRHSLKKMPPADFIAHEEADESDGVQDLIASGWTYNAVGLSYQDIGNHDLAAGYFQRVLWVSEQSKDSALLSAGLRHLGDSYRALGYLDEAIEHHKQQAVLARKIDDPAGECDALGSLGKDYVRLNRFKDAATCFEMQLDLAEKLNDSPRKGRALSNIADTSLAMGQKSDALKAYKRALRLIRRIENPLHEGRILAGIGSIYIPLKHAKPSLIYLEKALAIAQRVGDRSGEGKAMGYLGVVQTQQKNLSRALWFFVNQLTIAQEIGDKVTEMRAQIKLGDIYFEMGNIEQAIESYQSGLDFCRDLNRPTREIDVLEKLGQSYLKNTEASKAVGFYEEALTLATDLGYHARAATLTCDAAQIYLQLNDYWQAKARYEQALTLAKNEDDHRIWANIAREFALLLARQNDKKRAIFYAEEAVRILSGQDYRSTEQYKNAKRTLRKVKQWWKI